MSDRTLAGCSIPFARLSLGRICLDKTQTRSKLGKALKLPLLHLRKEVIQPHLPIRLPCYDFTPVIGFTFDDSLLAVRTSASGAPNFRGVTGGVYKARERIHRDMLIRDY